MSSKLRRDRIATSPVDRRPSHLLSHREYVSSDIANEGLPRTQAPQIASSNFHRALATSSLRLALASPASSRAPRSPTHSVSSANVLRSQCEIESAFEFGGTKAGRDGVALGSEVLACGVIEMVGECVDDERAKNCERSVT